MYLNDIQEIIKHVPTNNIMIFNKDTRYEMVMSKSYFLNYYQKSKNIEIYKIAVEYYPITEHYIVFVDTVPENIR